MFVTQDKTVLHLTILCTQQLLLTLSKSSTLTTYTTIMNEFIYLIKSEVDGDNVNGDAGVCGSIIGIGGSSLVNYTRVVEGLVPMLLMKIESGGMKVGDKKGGLLALISCVKARTLLMLKSVIKNGNLIESLLLTPSFINYRLIITPSLPLLLIKLYNRL